MKHLELFENWHITKVCDKCNGTGQVGTKQQSIEKILNGGTKKQFLDYIGDVDFMKNAIDLFRERGVHTVKAAKLVAALDLTRDEMQDIIRSTVREFDFFENVMHNSTAYDVTMSVNKSYEELERIIEDRPKVLAILRGR
jgi:hypothetical protein